MRRWMIGLAVVLLVATCGLARTHYVKTNTATKIVVGPFYDGTDHETPETGLTVGDIDCELAWDNAGTPALVELTLTASGGDNDCALLSGSENGLYTLELTAANVNYLGTGTITFRDPNNTFDSFSENLLARPAHVHDGLITGSDYVQVDAVQVGSATPISTTDIGTSVATELTDIGLDHLLSASVTGTDVTDNSIIAKLVSKSATADWDDYVNTTDSLQAHTDSYLAEILTDTGAMDTSTELRTLLTGSDTAVSTLTAANVNAEVDTALADIYLDHWIANALTDPNNVANNSILAKLASSSATAAWTSFVNTTDSLQAISDSVIPPPSGMEQDFPITGTCTVSAVNITVTASTTENCWKDCLVLVSDSGEAYGAYSRIAYNTAMNANVVTLYLSRPLPYVPTTGTVYIAGWGVKPDDIPRGRF